MKVTLVGAGSFLVGKIICKKDVETEVDEAAFEHLKPTVKGWFEVGGKKKSKSSKKEEPKTDPE